MSMTPQSAITDPVSWDILDSDSFWHDFFSQPFVGMYKGFEVTFRSETRRIRRDVVEKRDVDYSTLRKILDTWDKDVSTVSMNHHDPECQGPAGLLIPDFKKLYDVMTANDFRLFRFEASIISHSTFYGIKGYQEPAVFEIVLQNPLSNPDNWVTGSFAIIQKPELKEYIERCPHLQSRRAEGRSQEGIESRV